MDMTVESMERESDMPWELPEGWAWTQLGEIANLRGEKVDPQSVPNLPFVGMDDIEAHGTKIIQTRPFGTMKSAGNRFHKNDVLYGRLRPYLNKTALASESGACSGELLAITPSNAVSPKYLQLFMHARRFVNTAMSTVSGDRPRIDFATIAAFDFPLAPIAEQRRIVARVDALFAEIAEGEAALEAAREGLDTFRRALLKAAVTGELTKDWREKSPVTETGHDLLARIRSERAAKGQAKGRGKRSPDAPPLDTAALPELPEGWAWGTVDELLEFVTSGSRGWKDYYADAGAIFVRAQNINSGVLDLSDVAYVALPSNAEGLRTRLKVGDVLVTITGANVTVSALVSHEIPEAYVNQHVALLRPLTIDVSDYLLLWLQAEGAGKTQLTKAAYGAGKPGLNLDNIREVLIAIPSPAEAAEILRRVSEALAASADTLAMLDAEAADAARLKQSILKAAFEGRLVPQDPADEPASAMLARLRATQSTARPAKRGRRRRS